MSLTQMLETIGKLEKDWDSYGADPISADVMDRATRLAAILDTQPRVIPGSDGSIDFAWSHGDHDVTINVSPNNRMSFVVNIYDDWWEADADATRA